MGSAEFHQRLPWSSCPSCPSPSPGGPPGAPGRGHPPPPAQGRKQGGQPPRTPSETTGAYPSAWSSSELLALRAEGQSLKGRVGTALGVAEAVFHLHANGLWHGALG